MKNRTKLKLIFNSVLLLIFTPLLVGFCSNTKLAGSLSSTTKAQKTEQLFAGLNNKNIPNNIVLDKKYNNLTKIITNNLNATRVSATSIVTSVDEVGCANLGGLSYRGTCICTPNYLPGATKVYKYVNNVLIYVGTINEICN